MVNNAVFNQHYYCKQLGKTLHTEFIVFACVRMYKQEAHAEVRGQLCRNNSLLPHYVGSKGQT